MFQISLHTLHKTVEKSDVLLSSTWVNRIGLSNYLLWQGAYSELVFRDELWPDFTREAFETSLEEYASRQRRFGGR